MSYDERCYALAEFFLERPAMLKTQTDASRVERLAIRIQATVDDFIAEEMDDKETGR